MTDATDLHQAQVANWDGPMGDVWAASEARTDRALIPVSETLFRAADIEPGEAVLDVGCGGGATTAQIAMDIGSTGRVVGLDVSTTLIALAEKRLDGTSQAEFLHADASTIAFPKPMFDLLFSRFGVMFFGDPVAAFTNLHRAMKPEGRLAFACWRSAQDNVWVSLPLRAAIPILNPFRRAAGDEPGPFAFGDSNRVGKILTDSGFTNPKFKQFDFTMNFPGTGLEGAKSVCGAGPLARIFRDQPEDLRDKATAAVAELLPQYTVGDRIELPASVWIVTAGVA